MNEEVYEPTYEEQAWADEQFDSRGQTAARMAAERAAVLFRHFGWTWRVRDGQSVEPYIPTVDEIEASLHDKVNWLYHDPDTRSVAGGRFVVQRADQENGHGTVYLLDLAEENPYTGEAMG